MLRLERILGHTSDAAIAKALHHVDHRGGVEYVVLDGIDTRRHRLRVLTDRGTDCAIALSRDEHLCNGAVLLLEDDRAVVVRMRDTQWLVLEARDAASALELGYFAGNMHWKVEFAGIRLRIAVDGPLERYLERINEYLKSERVRRIHEH
ncbi:MAG: urease accessory protein UreE [Proteobacteria bacterium]|nr:MAG: urease accessory protein UreE [Pseudomonadota bacterium]